MPELPVEFLNNMKKLLGDEDYRAYLRSFSDKRVYGLRVNTDKITVSDFLKISPFSLEAIPWTHNGFYYRDDVKPGKHPYYFAGLYYLQEPSAMTPAEMLPVSPGDRVLDLCAAPGGKSTALLNKLRGTGVLFSNDISNSRAQALLKNLELFGAKNAVILSDNPQKLKERFSGYFDKILIDAPCSGEGMFRKEPAVIKSFTEHGNAFYVKLQREIVKNALQMLKPGGMLLYSTCTFSPLEDEETVLYMKSLCDSLLIQPPANRYEGFSEGVIPDNIPEGVPEDFVSSLKDAVRIFPFKVKGEGHFICLLKKGNAQDIQKPEARQKVSDPGKIPGYKKLHEETKHFLDLLSLDYTGKAFENRNGKVYLIPDSLPDMTGLRIMRTGLYLGDEEKNRFEPSQALAMALKPEEFRISVSLPSDDLRVIKYLKGETIDFSDIDAFSEGYALFCVESFPLGFGKLKNGILKNKYLPGWRYQ